MLRFALALALVSSAAYGQDGTLVIIGGGPRPDAVMQAVVDLAGGPDGKVVVVPFASGDPTDVGPYQQEQLLSYGLGEATVAYGPEPDADSLLALFDGATGVFLSGGDQRRLTAKLLGTRMLERVRAVYDAGGVVAGTSAGAAVMSTRMITGDERLNPDSTVHFANLIRGNVITTPGFGFVEWGIIDQHFVRRKRQNRLLSLTLERPDLVGIGIDEATAIVVDRNSFRVVGDGAVLVYDARQASVAETEEGRLQAGRDLRLHVLRAGDVFEVDG